MQSSEYLAQEDAQATHWWYVGRRRLLRWVLEDLQKKSGQQPFENILDIGCGVGGNFSVLRQASKEVIGIDPSPEACRLALEKGYARVIQAQLLEAKAEGTADVVIAMDILEHLPDDQEGMRHLVSLVKPGGWIVITVPAFKALWGLQDDVSHHFRRYRKTNLLRLAEQAGLKKERQTYFNAFLFLPILFARWAMRIVRPKNIRSENDINAPWMNAILRTIFLMEIWMIRRGLRFPFGVSLLLVVRRPLVAENNAAAL